MQDIAEAVNLQKPSLYHHFSSKQEILVAILDQALDILISSMSEILSSQLSPQEKLNRAMNSYLQLVLERRDIASVLLLEHRSLEQPLRRHHVAKRDRYETLWRMLLDEGIAVGAFSIADTALSSRFILGIMNWTLTWYREDGVLSPSQIAEAAYDSIYSGIKRSDCCDA
jgi:AcrR family transcriptional regulator